MNRMFVNLALTQHEVVDDLGEDAEDLLVAHLGEDAGAYRQHVDPREGAPCYVPPEYAGSQIYVINGSQMG